MICGSLSVINVSGLIWPKFKLIQTLIMHVNAILITCKFKKDCINSNQEKVDIDF